VISAVSSTVVFQIAIIQTANLNSYFPRFISNNLWFYSFWYKTLLIHFLFLVYLQLEKF
jgi:hypothetical protein